MNFISIYNNIKNQDKNREAKLRLLHDCLHPKTAALVDQSNISENQKTIVNQLMSEKNNLSSTYIDGLRKLRDIVLRET